MASVRGCWLAVALEFGDVFSFETGTESAHTQGMSTASKTARIFARGLKERCSICTNAGSTGPATAR